MHIPSPRTVCLCHSQPPTPTRALRRRPGASTLRRRSPTSSPLMRHPFLPPRPPRAPPHTPAGPPPWQPPRKDQAAQLLCGTGRPRLRADGVRRHPTPGRVHLRGHAPVSSSNGAPRRSCRAAPGHAAAAPLPEAQDDFVLSLALKACIRSAEYGYGTRLHCDAVKAGGANGFM